MIATLTGTRSVGFIFLIRCPFNIFLNTVNLATPSCIIFRIIGDIPIREGGLDSLQNLKALCRKCHRLIERGPIIDTRDTSIWVSDKLRVRLGKIRARWTLKDGKEMSMEELLEMLANVYEEKEREDE